MKSRVWKKTGGALTRAKAAAYLGICERKFDALAASGEIKAIRIGRKPVFTVRELDRFLNDLDKEQNEH